MIIILLILDLLFYIIFYLSCGYEIKISVGFISAQTISCHNTTYMLSYI